MPSKGTDRAPSTAGWCATIAPHLPERTRLFRLFVTHQHGADRFLADPTVLGVADTDGIAFIHPRRERRSSQQQGEKGLSNHRCGCPLGRVGGKLGVVLNQWGLVAAWDCATANLHHSSFQPLVAQFAEEMIVLTDRGFHAKAGDPPNMKACAPRTGNVRMVVETVFSMVTTVCDAKGMRHRVWATFAAYLAFLMAIIQCVGAVAWAKTRQGRPDSSLDCRVQSLIALAPLVHNTL